MQADKSFSTDDGEPSHSAGAPILAAIKSLEMSNVLVIVIRYFGGTKLGVRGLIEAYRTAAEDALSHTEAYPLIPMVNFRLNYTYEQTSLINKLLHPFIYTVVKSTYTDSCEQIISIRESEFPKLAHVLERAGYHFHILT